MSFRTKLTPRDGKKIRNGRENRPFIRIFALDSLKKKLKALILRLIWFSRLVSRICHRTFTDGLAWIIKCRKKRKWRAARNVKRYYWHYNAICLTSIGEIAIHLSWCEWNVIFNSDVYKGRKKNKSRAWWTTCEKYKMEKQKKKRSTSAWHRVRKTRNYLSRVQIWSIKLAWFSILEFVHSSCTTAITVRKNNGRGKRMKSHTPPARRHSGRSFIGINEAMTPNRRDIPFTGRAKLNPAPWVSPSSGIWRRDQKSTNLHFAMRGLIS